MGINLSVFLFNKMIENLLNEEWKPVNGFEGLYEISNYSRIKSIKFPLHRIMNPSGELTPGRKYFRCRLRNGKGGSLEISNHRVAALHFIPNPKPTLFTDVNHIDGNPENNHISNLEWVSHRDNILHGKCATNPNKSSKYKGVSYVKRDNSWKWAVYINGRTHRKCGFKTEDDAYVDYVKFNGENGLSLKYI